MARKHERGSLNWNGMPFSYVITQSAWNQAIALMAVNGYYGKPFFCGMTTYGSTDLLARLR